MNLIKRIPDLLKEEEIEIMGWVHELRDLGGIRFIVLRHYGDILQIALPKKEVPKELFEKFSELTKEDIIVVKGKLKESPKAPHGKELLPEEIKIISKSEQPLPIDISGKIETALDKRIDWRFLDVRRPEVFSIFRLQSKIIFFLNEFMQKNGFTRISTSKLVGAPTEGGAEYFPVLYFDREAFLAQSPQFYKELALASGFNRVYEIGFVYRAEPHHTPRHLCEYNSFDFEMVAFSMEEVMQMEEKLLKYVFDKINSDEECKDILKMHGVTLSFPNKIPRVTLEEANKKILPEMGVEVEEGDISPEGERALCRWAEKEHGSEFVFLTEFPWKKKPFYVKKKGEKASWSFDLLYRGLEITTGGLREENYEQRVKNAIEKGYDPKQYDHLRFWKYGIPPHGGLAIGIERLTMQILKLGNVREASLTPRDPTRLTP